jgi:hypothetical protein
MKPNKPNIVRVERDEWTVGGGRRFYRIFYDKPTDDEFVTTKDGEHYTYLIADDELQAWTTTQKTLDVQYGKD